VATKLILKRKRTSAEEGRNFGRRRRDFCRRKRTFAGAGASPSPFPPPLKTNFDKTKSSKIFRGETTPPPLRHCAHAYILRFMSGYIGMDK
jgi:hypothetical protein